MTTRNYHTFNVSTDYMTHFDCRDIEDLINSRRRNNDTTPTRSVYSNFLQCFVAQSEEMFWDAEENREAASE